MAIDGSQLELTETPDGPALYWRGRRLTPPRASDTMARRLPSPVQSQTLYILASPLFAFGTEAWLAHHLGDSSAVLAIELEPALCDARIAAPALRRRQWNVCWIENTTDDYERCAHAATQFLHRLFRFTAIRRVVLVPFSGGAALRNTQYRQLEEQLTTVVRDRWLNGATQLALARRWVVNGWRNAVRSRWETPTIRQRAAVLVAAGPSLRGALPIVEAAQRGGAAVVALDTSLPVLAEMGIMANLVVALDSQIHNARDLLPWRGCFAPLLADVTVHPTIARYFERCGTRFVRSTFTVQHWFAGLFSEILPLGSVGAAAVAALPQIAPQLERVLLVGMDFDYDPEMTHSTMSAAHRGYLRSSNRLAGLSQVGMALRRPREVARRVDGAMVNADAALYRNARAFASVAAKAPFELRRFHEPHQYRALPHTALELGVALISVGDAVDWLLGGVSAGAPMSTKPAGSYPVRQDETVRRRLRELEAALSAQIQHIKSALSADRNWYLDAELEFLTLDVPGWPPVDGTRRLTQTMLRSALDYRRRLRSVLIAATQDGEEG